MEFHQQQEKSRTDCDRSREIISQAGERYVNMVRIVEMFLERKEVREL